MPSARRVHLVRQGDYLTKIAASLGLDAEKIWNDPANADLKKLRTDPEQLAPGDILHVPETTPVLLPLRAGTVNKYVVKVVKVNLHLVLRDAEGPLANEPYAIEGLGRPTLGTTSEEGEMTVLVPIHLRELHVHLYERNLTLPVYVGHMDPIEEESGAKKRLAHLGYHGWEVPIDSNGGTSGPTGGRVAVAAFQSAQGLEPTGTLDTATSAALKKAHGSLNTREVTSGKNKLALRDPIDGWHD